MSTHNFCFDGEISHIVSLLSLNMHLIFSSVLGLTGDFKALYDPLTIFQLK